MKIISHLYKTLLEELTDNNLDAKEKWELAINTINPDDN